MSPKLPLGSFKWVEKSPQFNEDFIKSYNEDSDEEHFLEVDLQYPENLHSLPNDLPFFPGKMKIKKKNKKLANLLNDRKEYVIHIRNLKQALNYGLVLKRVYEVIKFNQEAWLKPYIDLNTELKKKCEKRN